MLSSTHLVEWRKAHNLSQAALATALEVTRNTVINWEKGRTRTPKWLRDRLHRLGVATVTATNARRQLIADWAAAYRAERATRSHDAVIASWGAVTSPRWQMTYTAFLSLPENADIVAELETVRAELDKGN